MEDLSAALFDCNRHLSNICHRQLVLWSTWFIFYKACCGSTTTL